MENIADLAKDLEHIAFIMDGNRRYAKQNKINYLTAYKKGLNNFFTTIDHCVELNIKYITFFAFSSENWGRSKLEIDTIMSVAKDAFESKKFLELIDKNIKITFIGNRSNLDREIQNKMKEIELASTKNNGTFVCVAVNYGGRDEIVNGVKKVAMLYKDDKLKIEDVNEDLFSKYMMTYPAPNPDLLVRTGNEKRISNFLIWQIGYCELYFCDKMWPSFEKCDLHVIVKEFSLRNRRYGKS